MATQRSSSTGLVPPGLRPDQSSSTGFSPILPNTPGLSLTQVPCNGAESVLFTSAVCHPVVTVNSFESTSASNRSTVIRTSLPTTITLPLRSAVSMVLDINIHPSVIVQSAANGENTTTTERASDTQNSTNIQPAVKHQPPIRASPSTNIRKPLAAPGSNPRPTNSHRKVLLIGKPTKQEQAVTRWLGLVREQKHRSREVLKWKTLAWLYSKIQRDEVMIRQFLKSTVRRPIVVWLETVLLQKKNLLPLDKSLMEYKFLKTVEMDMLCVLAVRRRERGLWNYDRDFETELD